MERRARQVHDAALDAGLAPEVADLLALAARGAEGTYRVGYDIAPEGSDQPERVTVTQRPPDRRLDVAHADGSADATIAGADGSFQCTASTTGAWRCDRLGDQAAAQGLFTTESIDALVQALTEGADQYDFAVETRTLLGLEARCLVTTRRADAASDPTLGETGTLCLSPEGARLLTESPAGTLRAVEYTTDIPVGAFDLPADPADPADPTDPAD